MPLTQVSTGMIADAAVTPAKLSTGAPSWNSAAERQAEAEAEAAAQVAEQP